MHATFTRGRHFFLVISRVQSPGPRLTRLVRESVIKNERLLPLLLVMLAELYVVGVGNGQVWFVQLPSVRTYLPPYKFYDDYRTATAELLRSYRVFYEICRV